LVPPSFVTGASCGTGSLVCTIIAMALQFEHVTRTPLRVTTLSGRVRTKLQEACAAEGVGARQADGLVEGLEADGAIWHCRSVWISAGGEAGSACSSSTAAEAWHGSQAPVIAREPLRPASKASPWGPCLGMWGWYEQGAPGRGVAARRCVARAYPVIQLHSFCVPASFLLPLHRLLCHPIATTSAQDIYHLFDAVSPALDL
jgi:hypothetical protein